MSKEQLLTSKNEVPKHKNALEEKYKEEKVEPTKRVDETNVGSIKDELPVPSGWRLLVLPFTPKEKTKGGIIIAQESLDKARIATNCGYVVKMGPMAYGDKEKFPTGPWCKSCFLLIFRNRSAVDFFDLYLFAIFQL